MVKRPIFAITLTISVIIILVGISLIIALQIDRGYVLANTNQDLRNEQDEIVREFYQQSDDQGQQAGQTASESATDSASKQAFSNNASRPTTPNTINSSMGAATAPADAYSTPYQRYLEYERQWLSSNPWSPDYRPPGAR